MAKLEKNIVEYYHFYCPGCKHLHTYAINSDGTGWNFNGNMANPSFSPSLLNTVPIKNEATGVYKTDKERCHLILMDGKINYCPDCTHELAGKSIDMVDIETKQ